VIPPTDLRGMTAVAYVRVSTEDQAGERQTSLRDQRAAIDALAVKLGVTVGHVFEDAGVSGAWQERPAFSALMASCEASRRNPRHATGFVLVLNDSRWGRFESSERSTYFRQRLEMCGWFVRFAEMDEIQDDSVRPVLRAIAQSQASLYRRNLKANVLRGCRGQAEQGYWQAKAPFGYQRHVAYPPGRERTLENHIPKATDEKLVLVPHPEEAPIVQTVFARYVAGGESLASLLDWVSRHYPRRTWTRAAMLRLLTNPAYVGDVVWGRVSVEPGNRSTRSSSQWYGKRDAHQALVSRDVFHAAQKRLGVNRHRTRGVRSDWIVSGLVRCRCGAALIGFGGARNGAPVYRCSTTGAHTARRCSYGGGITKHLLEDAAIQVLAKEIGSTVHRRAMAAAIDRVLEESRTVTRTQTDIARDLELVRQKQRRIVLAIESGALTPHESAARMTELRREQDRLTDERERSTHTAGDHTAWRDELVTQALDFRTMAAELKGPALRELIARWIARAEFNTTTRELTMEIRRVPAVSMGQSLTVSQGFVTEGEPSRTKPQRKASGLDATITRVVIVGRRRVA
jgi:DNA invertase Pin-like site-specific DNA recombinase